MVGAFSILTALAWWLLKRRLGVLVDAIAEDGITLTASIFRKGYNHGK
jgi:hypothetical protein